MKKESNKLPDNAIKPPPPPAPPPKRLIKEDVHIVWKKEVFKPKWIGDATTPPPPKWPESPEMCRESGKPNVPKPKGPLYLPKEIAKDDTNKEFLKGMTWAFLVVILLHVIIAYILLY